MRRLRKIALIAAGLPLLAAAIVIGGGNTGPGRDVIARATPWFSGGMVTIEGLSGRFPDALRLDRVVVSDRGGPWLRLDRVRLDWSPLRLFRGQVRVERLAAAQVAVSRLPQPSVMGGTGGAPIGIAVADARVDRLDLAAAIAGLAVSLRLKGGVEIDAAGGGRIALAAERLDGVGSYKLEGRLGPDRLTGRIEASEPPHGPLSALAGLPDIGPLSLTMSLDGPRRAEQTRVSLAAGPLTARAEGTLDLDDRLLDIDASATAPAMTPRSDLKWQSLRLDLHLHGPFTAPQARGHLEIEAPQTAAGAAAQLTAELHGEAGAVEIAAALAGLHLSGPRPDLFAAAPLTLNAKARLDTPRRPVSFTLSHPLLEATGTAENDSGALAGSIALKLPSLMPFADVAGRAGLNGHFRRQGETTSIAADGTIAVTGGNPAAVALIGDDATFALSGTLGPDTASLDDLALHGRALRLAAKGRQTGAAIDLGWKLELPEIAALTSRVTGGLSAVGRLQGTLQDFAVIGQASGRLGVAGLPPEPIGVSLQAQGLPAAPSGSIEAQGRLAGAPLQIAAAVNRQAEGGFEIALTRLQWKSAAGQGKVSLAPGSVVPLGQVRLHLARLDDLAPLTGVKASGAADITLDTLTREGEPQAHVTADVQHLSVAGASLDRLTADARISDPLAHPSLALALGAEGLRQGTVTGSAHLTANGPAEALALRLTSDLRTPHGPATVTAGATAHLSRRELQLSGLQARYLGQTAQLLAPARIDLMAGAAVDNLRLGVGGAVVAVSGRIAPALDLTLSARNLTPALAQPWLPELHGTGTASLDGRLQGALSAPQGSLQLRGRGLRATTGDIAGLPPADIDATAMLAGGSARLDARLAAGAAHLQLTGTAPLQAAAPLALHLYGTADLAMLDPLLTPDGRAAAGRATLDLAVAGSPSAPRASGTIQLAHGSVQDFAQGIRISDLNGLVQADGDVLRIAHLDGQAGPGTVSIAGTIGLLQSEMPLALSVTARNARPIDSALLTATMNADLRLDGRFRQSVKIGGEIHVARANINIPDSLPQGTAVLNVRRPGMKRLAPPSSSPTVALALTVVAPDQVFVRGHGVDAEMGGTLKLAGSAAVPVVGGGFDLRRGAFSLAGTTLTFTSGRIAFDGGGLGSKLDPSLDLVAQSTANNITATLRVTGYADAPRIKLSSAPEMPEDEILGQLLFGQSIKQLSPFQLAQIAQALAALGGVGGGDPLASVRGRLGLDRLSVGSSGVGSGAAVEAGKYVAKGVYLGARQGIGAGTQAEIQIDLTKHLKFETTIGTGAAAAPTTGVTPQNDPGNRVGFTYQFEY